MHTMKKIVSTHLFAFQEEVDRFEYFDDLAMWAAIKIVDADNKQVLHILGALGFKHVKENLQSQQYVDIESSGTQTEPRSCYSLVWPFGPSENAGC